MVLRLAGADAMFLSFDFTSFSDRSIFDLVILLSILADDV